MANTLPGKSENKNTAPAAKVQNKGDEPVNTSPADVALNFQDAPEMPDAKELNQSSNPFQEKVNELAKSGNASSVVIPVEKESWARTMIRRAANNIDMGTRTKVQKVEGDPTKVRVWFRVTTKVKRAGSSS